jgi:hypothetical protein
VIVRPETKMTRFVLEIPLPSGMNGADRDFWRRNHTTSPMTVKIRFIVYRGQHLAQVRAVDPAPLTAWRDRFGLQQYEVVDLFKKVGYVR